MCTGAKGSQYSLRVPFSPENEEKIAVLQKNLSKFEISDDEIKLSERRLLSSIATLCHYQSL